MLFENSIPKGDCGLQPQVARNEQPGVQIAQFARQAQRGWGTIVRTLRQPAGTLSAFIAVPRPTQGRSFLATLGFAPKSLRDSTRISIFSRFICKKTGSPVTIS